MNALTPVPASRVGLRPLNALWALAFLGVAMSLNCHGCRETSEPGPGGLPAGEVVVGAPRDKAGHRVDGTAPPPREPGPARPESAQAIERTRKEVDQWTRSFRQSGLGSREISSLADIRGYRLYRRRNFRRAQLWFDAAVAADPSFEVPLYNAARVAALNGDRGRAVKLLAKLAALNTPLAKRRLQLAAKDPDLQGFRPLD